MQIADNVLAWHLQQVYWVSGTACSGKTTVASALATKHGLGFYNADEMYEQHLKLAVPVAEQPFLFGHESRRLRLLPFLPPRENTSRFTAACPIS